jgi:hypothetical protein
MASFIAKTYFLLVKISTRNRKAEVYFTASKPFALRQMAPRPLGTHVRAFEAGRTPANTEDKNASGRPISCKTGKQVGSL